MVILTTMIGFAILAMGRQIFWIFVAGLGFVLGLVYGEQFFSEQPEWVILMIGALMGLMGVLLANYLQRFAGGIAGFATGWYLTNMLIGYSHPNLEMYTEVAPIAAGLLCAILMVMYFDWSAILLSSLAGAAILVTRVEGTDRNRLLLLMGFALLGAFIQSLWYIQENRKGKNS